MISVIIPTYNRAALVSRAIDSVLAQTRKADEIIVVDDGSTDETQEVLSRYHDSIHIITQVNTGVSSARNSGIRASKGRWITLLDSDDIWHPTKLQRQKSYHDRHPHSKISHTKEQWIRNGKVIKQKSYHDKPQGWCFQENLCFCKIAPSTIMIEREVFDKVGLFDTTLTVCEDYDLWLRILRHYALGLVEEVLTTKYAGHANQLSFSTPMMDSYRIQALLKHNNLTSVQEEIIKKCHIVMAGAKKRGNWKVVHAYENLLQKVI